MTTIKGKANISAEVICDSVSSVNGKRITTFVLEYPRIVHSELKTHRMLSTNSASSRAIPFDKMIENLNGIPVRFGAANKGMQDKGEDYEAGINFGDGLYAYDGPQAWLAAKEAALSVAKGFYDAKYAKQIYNRLVEPFSMIRTIVTATEFENFFWLRDDAAADPTIQELARCMKEAREQSVPQVLKPGEWHLPFVDTFCDDSTDEFLGYCIGEYPYEMLSLEEAIIVACARCAAVSFRRENYDLAKCKEVYNRLVGGERIHASALEHCATPMYPDGEAYSSLNDIGNFSTWQQGITHSDREGKLWSGNFESWVQYRQLILNESKKG